MRLHIHRDLQRLWRWRWRIGATARLNANSGSFGNPAINGDAEIDGNAGINRYAGVDGDSNTRWKYIRKSCAYIYAGTAHDHAVAEHSVVYVLVSANVQCYR